MIEIYVLCGGYVDLDQTIFFPDRAPGTRWTVPIPGFLVVHPEGRLLFDTGIHCGAIADPIGRLGERRAKLFGLRSLAWEPELLSLFGVDASWLPVVRSTTGDLGVLAGRRLTALACDQQAALAGHGAFNVGAVKATYGTGVFVLANAGPRRDPAPGLEVSIAWRIGDEPAASAPGAAAAMSTAATATTKARETDRSMGRSETPR